MFRNTFNAGELSEQVSLRPELDVYARGCSKIVNFDLSEQGGLTRRKGFRAVQTGPYQNPIEFDDPDCALLVFYASDDVQCLLGLTHGSGSNEITVKVYTPYDQKTGMEYLTVSATRTMKSESYIEDLREIKAVQLNATMIFVHPFLKPKELSVNASKAWTLEDFKFKTLPWRTYDTQNNAMTLTRTGANKYTISGTNVGVDCMGKNDIRFSYYTDAEEIKIEYHKHIEQIENFDRSKGIISGVTMKKGYFLSKSGGGTSWSHWVLKENFPAAETANDPYIFVPGLIYPGNYPNVFEKACGDTGFNTHHIISNIKVLTGSKKGDGFTFIVYYANLYTAKVDGAKTTDKNTLFDGMLIGYAPCKGKWRLYNSGTWYGELRVLASYDKEFSMDGQFELRGSVFSPVENPVNQEIAGDESDEECWLALVMSKIPYNYDVRRESLGGDWDEERTSTERFTYSGGADIRLVIDSYKKDITLHREKTGVSDLTGLTITSGFINHADGWKKKSYNWGVQAFYGTNQPTCATLIDQRLCFAGTIEQPMTVWMSKTNDIDNFDVTESDDSAMALTIASDTQEPIRWLASQRGRLLVGTSRGEFVISSGGEGVITNKTATAIQHGFNGSERVGCTVCDDSVIYVAKGGRRAKRYGYAEDVDGYVSTDLNTFAEEILMDGGGVKQIAVSKNPISRVFFVLNNGTLAVLTYNMRQNVFAWSRYTFGHLGTFYSIAVLENKEGDDSLYVTTDETIHGGLYCLDKYSNYGDAYYTAGATGSYLGSSYTSEFITNILQSTGITNPKQNVGQLMIYFGEDTPSKYVEITVDGGETWSPLDAGEEETIPKGWYSQLGFGTITWDAKVGVRTSGWGGEAHGLNIKAIQII